MIVLNVVVLVVDVAVNLVTVLSDTMVSVKLSLVTNVTDMTVMRVSVKVRLVDVFDIEKHGEDSITSVLESSMKVRRLVLVIEVLSVKLNVVL